MNTKHRGVSTESRSDLDAEGPLRRWARRKREVAREEKAADEARRRDDPRDTSGAAGRIRESAGDAPDPDTVEERVLTDEDMPPLESLDENSDYSGFLSSGVSEALRRRALRKLFSSAVFNIPDGLDDYDDDFTSFAALGDIVTSDMKHQAEMEAERAKRTQARAETETGTEEGPPAAEEERLESADDDTTVRAQTVPADGTEPSEPAAFTEPVPPDAVTDAGAAENGERSAPPSGTGRRSRGSVADAGSPADAQAPHDVRATGEEGGAASRSGEPAAPAGHSATGPQASAGSEVPANAGEVEPRGA